PLLSKSVLDGIPQKPGIYYFKNQKGEIIYVGKAVNLKKRVLGHFYDKSAREIQMCRETADISFALSGSELLALLMESSEIKRLFPLYNRAQKRTPRQYVIFAYQDRNGIQHLAYNPIKGVPKPLKILYSQTDCRAYLETLCKAYSLCPKYCHLQHTLSTCSHHEINSCEGICREAETVEGYNKKVERAITHMEQLTPKAKFIREQGRDPGEQAVVLIADGIYKGYGFIDSELELSSIEDLEAHVIPQRN